MLDSMSRTKLFLKSNTLAIRALIHFVRWTIFGWMASQSPGLADKDDI